MEIICALTLSYGPVNIQNFYKTTLWWVCIIVRQIILEDTMPSRVQYTAKHKLVWNSFLQDTNNMRAWRRSFSIFPPFNVFTFITLGCGSQSLLKRSGFSLSLMYQKLENNVGIFKSTKDCFIEEITWRFGCITGGYRGWCCLCCCEEYLFNFYLCICLSLPCLAAKKSLARLFLTQY